MKLTGVHNEWAGAAVSLGLSILSMGILAAIAWRFLNPWVAVLSVGFFTTCFSDLGVSRRAWGDSTAGFFGLLVIWIACEIRHNPRRTLLYPVLILAGTSCLLTKETAIFAYALCGLWLAGGMAFERKSWPLFCRVAVSGIGSIVLGCAVWIVLAGSPKLAWLGVRQSVGSGMGSDIWGEMYSSGPWYQYIYLLWLVGPVTLLMAALGIAVSGRSSNWFRKTLNVSDRGALSLALFVTVCFLGAAAFGPNLQSLRLFSPANGCYCLLAGLGIWAIACSARSVLSRTPQRILAACLAGAMFLAAIRDYRTFNTVVVESGMEDLAAYGVRYQLGR